MVTRVASRTRGRGRGLLRALVSMVVAAGSGRGGLAAEEQQHEHDGASHRGADLHFSHPLIAESVSPDTKVRVDYFFRSVAAEGGDVAESTFRLESEYAFHRSVSVEIDLPYTIRDVPGSGSMSHLDEAGLPTGNDASGIGSGHIVDLEPLLRGGYRQGPLEASASTGFGIPMNQHPGEEIETGDSGSVVNLTPGVKVRPMAHSPLLLGLGLGVPLSAARAFDARLVLSAFYHLATGKGGHE